MNQIDGIERETGPDPEFGVIWLHGLGADASDFLPIIDQLILPAACRFVFPNAPLRPVTVNGGMVMRAWYDIYSFGPDAREDRAGLSDSVAFVQRLIDRECERGIASDRIVLVGFSQGGAVVQHAGLTAKPQIGSVIGLSTYLPAAQMLVTSADFNPKVPVWLTHGTMDVVLPLSLAEYSARTLRQAGVSVDWSTYPMGHEVSYEELRDLNRWFARFVTR